MCIFGKNTVNLALLWCFTHVFTQFCRLFFIFWCAIIVLKLVVGNEKIYKLKNGKEPDPRGKNKSLVFYKFWFDKKSKRNTKRTKSCVEVMYFTCVYLCVTCVHMLKSCVLCIGKLEAKNQHVYVLCMCCVWVLNSTLVKTFGFMPKSPL